MHYSFKNKTVIVTGAGRGIGKATAIAFAKAGANIVLASRTQSTLDEVQTIIAEFNPNVIVYQFDAKDKASCEDLVAQTVKCFGTVDIIVHSASELYFTPIDSNLDQDIANHFDSSVSASHWLLKAAMPYLNESEGKGRFIAIGSIAGTTKTVSGMTAYCVAKSSLNAFIRQAAWEYGFANKQVLINSVLPGTIASDRLLANYPKEMVEKGAKFNVPIRRPGEPEEVAKVCLFLASPGASFIHGASIVVDGGQSLGPVM